MANEKITDWHITLDQLLEQIRLEALGTMDKYFDFLQKTNSSHPFGGTELGDKATNFAEKNIAIARDYVHKLSRAKDFLEAVPIQTEFMQSQLESFGEQIKSLGETYAKATREMLNTPLKKPFD
jgi:hypothetical protein